MIIQKIMYDNLGICRALIQGDSGKIYNTNIDNDDNRYWCSCDSYVYNKGNPCKHISLLLMNLEFEKMVNKRDSLDKLSTGSVVIDKLLGGGIPYGTITTLYGEPKAGKSMLCYQAGLGNIANTGLKTLYIDTEGIRRQDFSSIVNKFNSRYQLSPTDVAKFEYTTTLGDLKLKSIQKLFQMFGVMPMLEMSKGGRYTVQFEPCAPTFPEEKWKDYSMIIVDSLTAPLKMTVGANTSNLPTRAQLTERLFGLLIEIAMRNNIAVVINHHASVNPMTLFGRDLGKPWGGDPILYNSKYALLILDADGKTKKETGWDLEARRIRLIRRPDEQDTNDLFPVRLKKDYGYTDK